jgi:hypothetical protein
LSWKTRVNNSLIYKATCSNSQTNSMPLFKANKLSR